MRTRMLAIAALVVTCVACTGQTRPVADPPGPRPSPSRPGQALIDGFAALPERTQAPYEPRPVIGLAEGLDYPGLHIGNSHAWGSMQGGVNMLVFSGTAGAYNAKGNYYAVAEICSVPAVSEDRRRRDLEHCYYNKKDRHTYRITGQRGYATQLLRDDGQRFVYGMQTGALSQA